MGTVAAPLLAGFALATVAVLVTANPAPRLSAQIGETLFALSAVSFVFSVQFAAASLSYAPGAEGVVSRSAHDVYRRFVTRSRLTYDLGILSYLGGLLGLLFPTQVASVRTVSAAVVVIAMILEVVWIISVWTGRRVSWLLPSIQD
jgi:hypothetical protein